MNEFSTDALIIGAGVTGLMMANCLKGEYIVVEKEEEIGGFCRTIKRNGFIWDYAGHFFHFNDKKMKDFFLTKMCDSDIVRCKKNTKIWYRKRLVDYPFQANIHELEKEEFIECLYALFFKTEKSIYENFEDMLYGKYGSSITEKFLKPYNEKLYACDLNYLDCNAMGRFFPNVAIKDIIGNMKENKVDSYNSEFVYPKGGAEEFVKVLKNGLDQKNLHLNSELLKINIEKKFATVKEKNQVYIIHYNKLINTIPFHQFLHCLDDGRYNKLMNKLSFNKVLVLNIGFDKNTLSYRNYHWIYFPEKEINFYRVGFYSNILNTDKLSIYVEIGFDKNNDINIKNEYEKTLENLKKIGIISDHRIIDYEAILMNPAYIHINSKHNLEINEVISQLRKKEIYTIGRYGRWKYCSIEDSMQDAVNLSSALNDRGGE